MADAKNTEQGQAGKTDESAVRKAEQGNEAVQAVFTEELEKGFRGPKIDPTPNEAYTVQGVVAGELTPETDHDAAVKASESGLSKFNNKGQA